MRSERAEGLRTAEIPSTTSDARLAHSAAPTTRSNARSPTAPSLRSAERQMKSTQRSKIFGHRAPVSAPSISFIPSGFRSIFNSGAAGLCGGVGNPHVLDPRRTRRIQRRRYPSGRGRSRTRHAPAPRLTPARDRPRPRRRPQPSARAPGPPRHDPGAPTCPLLAFGLARAFGRSRLARGIRGHAAAAAPCKVPSAGARPARPRRARAVRRRRRRWRAGCRGRSRRGCGRACDRRRRPTARRPASAGSGR